MFVWGLFCLFLCIFFSTQGAFESVYTHQTDKQPIQTHLLLQINILPSFLGRKCCLKKCFKESPRHSRILPLCHLNQNYTKRHMICTKCLLKSQNLFPQAPLGLLPFTKCFLREIRQFVWVKDLGFFSPPLTQRQFHLRSEADAQVVELRKAMMC